MSLNISQELPTLWKSHLAAEFEKDYILRLHDFLRDEKDQAKSILPSSSL